ncbi:MAG TPA: S-methyl-5'-thioadenosine phosphorylase [Dehalococcoidia bacterium]|nr:S-methyl-5'-thioadenosine phosphorylase [Dehalococcoidia bacterium]
MTEAQIGIIGGTGLYQMEGISDVREVRVNTPFGQPSDAIILGTLEGKRLAFLPRHGRGHLINPTQVPYRANFYALKSLGVERIIAINSAGSFQEELAPGHLVVPDQVIDRTRTRESTFFDRKGLVVHIPFAEPFCPVLREVLCRAAQQAGAKVHDGGTFIAMEGPQFSTRAESRLYRSWGASIIGMTVFPEARLAREAEMCYASLASVSDYDSWHEEYEPVTAETILAVLRQNVEVSKRIIRIALGLIPEERRCLCPEALKTAIATSPKDIPPQLKRDLALLIGKYVG